MKSLQTTNAKWRSIFLIFLLVLIMGLVGIFSFNLSNNEVIAEASGVISGYLVDDFPAFNYNNLPTVSWGKGVMFDSNSNIPIFYANKISNLGGDSYVVYNNLADLNNLLTSSVYSIRAYSSGTKKITYDNNGLRFPVQSGKGSLFVYIACTDIALSKPAVNINWYNSSGEYISTYGTGVSSGFYSSNTFELLSVSETAPAGATSFTIELMLYFSESGGKTAQYYLLPGYTYISSSTIPRVSIKEMQFLSDLYKDGVYWKTRYLDSEYHLYLAQEQGATFVGTLESIITAPINAVAEFMTFEIPFFNINLGTILAIIISLMLVAFVIKILLNKG